MAANTASMILVAGAVIIMGSGLIITISGSYHDNITDHRRHTDENEDDGFTWRCNPASYDPSQDIYFDGCVEGIKKILREEEGSELPALGNLSPTCGQRKVTVCFFCHHGCYAHGDCCAQCMHQLSSVMDQYCVHTAGAYFNGAGCDVRYETYDFTTSPKDWTFNCV